MLVTREVSLGKVHSGIDWDSLVVSPDNKRVAYSAKRGLKEFVVVDGEEGKRYDWIAHEERAYSILFSPDSKRVAYVAVRVRLLPKEFVVVDEVKGKKYDDFLNDGKLVFDNPKSLHALACRGKKIFRVEIDIVEE